MQHLLITRISNMGKLYVGECICGTFYVESLGQDLGSVAELKTAYDEHVKVQL
jgi:hypothetical protein